MRSSDTTPPLQSTRENGPSLTYKRISKGSMGDQECVSILRSGEEIGIRVARSLAEVEALREPWMSWPGHRDSDIDVFLMIVQSLPEVARPHVVALYRGGKLESILVGRLEHKRLIQQDFRVGYLSLFRPWARCLTFVYGAIRGNASPENAEILVRAVMDSLRRNEADVAMCHLVPLETPLYRLALALPGILSRDTLPKSQAHDCLTVPASIDDVYRRMSPHRRHRLKATIKKIERGSLGKVSIVCYTAPPELDKLFHDAEEIAKKTYQRGLGVGFADNPAVRRRLELYARKGWLRAFVLYIGHRPSAFWIGVLYRGTCVGEYTGFDREFDKYSPGMFLLMRVIERFCNRVDGDTVRELDFGPGHAEYKKVLCSQTWQEANVFIFSPTLRGLVLKLMRTATRLLDGAARRALASIGMLPRLKRVWRDRLARRQGSSSKTTKPTSKAAAVISPQGEGSRHGKDGGSGKRRVRLFTRQTRERPK